MVDLALNSWSAAAGLQHVEALPAGAVVRVRVEPLRWISRSAQRVRLMIYEFYRPDNTFYLDGHTPGGRRARTSSRRSTTTSCATATPRLLWVDRQVGIGLWREPSAD